MNRVWKVDGKQTQEQCCLVEDTGIRICDIYDLDEESYAEGNIPMFYRLYKTI